MMSIRGVSKEGGKKGKADQQLEKNGESWGESWPAAEMRVVEGTRS